MPALPPVSDFTGTTRTNAQMRTTHGALHAYLVGLLGADGEAATALAALGALAATVGSRSATGTLSAATDRGRLILASGTITLTLPGAAAAGAGWACLVANTGSGTVTLARAGADLIDGATSVALDAGRAALVVSTATGWITLALPGTGGGPVLARAGSASAPGLAFPGDTDTGLYRIAADTLGIAAGGAERVRVTTGGMQVTGAITGTAVTSSATDTTAGRLIKTGDFGLGGPAAALSGATNLKDRGLAGGLYEYAANVVPGGPESATWFHALFLSNLPNGTRRAGFSIRATATDNIRAWVGSQSSDTGDFVWDLLFARRSVLGTVSQSGGVPTGALIETGSNANGRYLRFADGTQLCWRVVSVNLAIDTSFLGGFRSAAQTWTFPAAFDSASSITLFVSPLNLTAFGGISANTTTSASADWAVTAVTSQTAATRTVALFATGRWF